MTGNGCRRECYCDSMSNLLVLANIIVCTRLLVNPLEALVATIWHIFLVKSPADAFILKKINNGRDVLRDSDEWITVESEVVAAYSSHIIWLRWMGDGIVLGQRDSLACVVLEVRCCTDQYSFMTGLRHLRSAAAAA
jgi:hypothetical protein